MTIPALNVFRLDDFTAGWFGGICGLLAAHPLDTIKVRQQTFGGSVFRIITTTARSEGYRGFYKGMSFPLLTIGPSNALFFGPYSNALRWLDPVNGLHHENISMKDLKTIWNIGIAGIIGGFVQVLGTCPTEVVKTKLQANAKDPNLKSTTIQIQEYNTLRGCIKGVFKHEGFLGFYRGFGPMLLRDVPPSSVYTIAYELLVYDALTDYDVPISLKQIFAGGVAGVSSYIVVVPFDFVKSRMQADNPENPYYKGMLHCFKDVYQKEGALAFTAGILPNSLRYFVAHGITFFGYEVMLYLFEKYI